LWFYFAVTNVEADRKVTFNILNCTKPPPNFKVEMKPWSFSEIEFEQTGVEWNNEVTNSFYKRNDIPRGVNENMYYTFSFCYTFKHTGDKVYFAYNRPYTTTMYMKLLKDLKEKVMEKAKSVIKLEENELQKEIKQFVTNENKKTSKTSRPLGSKRVSIKEEQTATKQPKFPETGLADINILKRYIETRPTYSPLKTEDYQIETETFICRKETLCYSFGGLPIELISITATRSKSFPMRKRKVIFITARVHAGEVTGSFEMEGILRHLTSNSKEVCHLRSIYIFKIVPMLNPEGVICGNSRCSITGTDLNRRWNAPDEILHPQVYYLKNLMKKLIAEKRTILVFCDLHGHTRKNSSFIYGCNKVANGGFCSWTKVRLLPRILAHKSPLFNYRECRFEVKNDKQRTARVVVWKEFGVTNSFTLESSFYGYLKANTVTTFNVRDYFALGEVLLSSLLEYHYLLKGLEKEMLVTKGWLKPSRLIELTGAPAADILERKIVKDKEDMRRKNNIMVFQSTMTSKIITRRFGHNEKQDQVVNYSIVLPKCERLRSNKKWLSENSLGISAMPKFKERIESNIKFPCEFSLINSSMDNERIDVGKRKFKNWKEYFSREEIEDALDKINKGITPNDGIIGEESMSESDSNASDDELDKDEIQDLVFNLPPKLTETTNLELTTLSEREVDVDNPLTASIFKSFIINQRRPRKGSITNSIKSQILSKQTGRFGITHTSNCNAKQPFALKTKIISIPHKSFKKTLISPKRLSRLIVSTSRNQSNNIQTSKLFPQILKNKYEATNSKSIVRQENVIRNLNVSCITFDNEQRAPKKHIRHVKNINKVKKPGLLDDTELFKTTFGNIEVIKGSWKYFYKRKKHEKVGPILTKLLVDGIKHVEDSSIFTSAASLNMKNLIKD